MAVLCPRCDKEGKRVEMDYRRIEGTQPKDRDRIAGELVSIPAIHIYTVEFKCPACEHVVRE